MSLTIESLKRIFPKYDYKYTDEPGIACATYLSDSNPFNLPPPGADIKKPPPCAVRHLTTDDIDWKGKARGLFYRYSAAGENVMCTKTTDECKGPDPVICRGRTRTRCTQTNYRESSAQTHSYLPEVTGDKKKYEQFEVYQISKLLDSCYPPGEYEAKVVERARRRRQFEKALKLVAHDKQKSHAILEAMEWEDWIAREEDIQSIQMLRMDMVLKLFKERENKFNENSQKRIEISANRIQGKQKAKLNQINVEYLRAMRQLEAKRQNLVTNYRKGNITENHVNPASDLRAPQMRFGVNPNRRHFVSFRKNFNDRINELDKRKDERGLTGLECPFSKLRTWAKPKERMKEVSQRFCSEENLKNLYESLKTLRTISEAHKPAPKCLQKKQVPEMNNDIPPPPSASQKKLSNKSVSEKPVPSESVEFAGLEDEPEQKEPITEKELLEILRVRRVEEVALKAKADILGYVAYYEGSVQGKLFKLLRDELGRLKLMKKFQTIQMIAERERWRRESAEAGRRQKENKFRDDNEVLYNATSAVHKDLATLFLKSVLEEEFEFTAEALATEKIVEFARLIDQNDLDCLRLQGRDRRSLYRAVIEDSLKNQVFKVVDKKLKKKHADLQMHADLEAITEELFMGVENRLKEEHHTPDGVLFVGELLDEIIQHAVTYEFDLFTPDTSDDEFYPEREVGAIIDKMLKNVVNLPGVKEDFLEDSEWQNHLYAEREAAAILRKMVRRTIPEQRWKDESIHIVEQTLSDTFNAAVYEVECMKTSRIVCADDRLHAAISEIYNRMDASRRVSDEPSSSSSSVYIPSHALRSIPSTIELFDKPEDESISVVLDEEFSTRKINYIDPEELQMTNPVELSRRHERYNIMGRVAKRYRHQETSGPDVEEPDEEPIMPLAVEAAPILSSSSSSSPSSDEIIGTYSSSYIALDILHPDFEENQEKGAKSFISVASYEKAYDGYEEVAFSYHKASNRKSQ